MIVRFMICYRYEPIRWQHVRTLLLSEVCDEQIRFWQASGYDVRLEFE